MQIACRWVDIHYPPRLWLDMKLSCCLHQLWLRGLSALCSSSVWEWRRYSNKDKRVNRASIRRTVFLSLVMQMLILHPCVHQSPEITLAFICLTLNKFKFWTDVILTACQFKYVHMSCWGLKRTYQLITVDKFCSQPAGIWKILLKEKWNGSNADVHFLWGVMV